MIFMKVASCNGQCSLDYSYRPMKDVLVKLLFKGCNPCAVDVLNNTPLHCALSSSASLLWFDSLQEAKFDIEEVSRQHNRIKGVVHDDNLLSQKYDEWIRSPALKKQIDCSRSSPFA